MVRLLIMCLLKKKLALIANVELKFKFMWLKSNLKKLDEFSLEIEKSVIWTACLTKLNEH